ncbi:hypothetical protein OUY22_06050 [Nonomuraea sp. MCN248]|uniref:Helix-hairpin-helix domain-containing protein n=1 Tax=Nonomuraea corallina TaxID=2989783 RepID=A0ABT4S7J9_9ACTN|nr:hypothetical protein [Nonomuraea corallina]MDA0632975.1 hypothetical protein [Nonomuraea corallina]
MTEGGGRVFTVGGEEFAALDPDAHVRLRLPTAEAGELVSQHPTAVRSGDWVRLPIADVNGQALNSWVRRAWLACAPPELAALASAAESADRAGDLPKAIGRPATRALAGAGITTLDQVARLSDAELGALHGVGPKAVRILREALDAR